MNGKYTYPINLPRSGGYANCSLGQFSAIGGGTENKITGTNGTIAGGNGNQILNGANFGVISGGAANFIDIGVFSFIGGGESNGIGGNCSAILGGQSNQVTGNNSVILGGANNSDGGFSFVGIFGNGLTPPSTVAGVPSQFWVDTLVSPSIPVITTSGFAYASLPSGALYTNTATPSYTGRQVFVK